MAQKALNALPMHLKPSSLGNGDADGFARKHHGKTQSHVGNMKLPEPRFLLGQFEFRQERA
ncbi:MAG: hypothetical protein M1836_006716 [Candelina mexicana]|nr:MAG: hypothetical protein M1836_006716 [Candelina mexicana]